MYLENDLKKRPTTLQKGDMVTFWNGTLSFTRGEERLVGDGVADTGYYRILISHPVSSNQVMQMIADISGLKFKLTQSQWVNSENFFFEYLLV
jgi:hypothetical protein